MNSGNFVFYAQIHRQYKPHTNPVMECTMGNPLNRERVQDGFLMRFQVQGKCENVDGNYKKYGVYLQLRNCEKEQFYLKMQTLREEHCCEPKIVVEKRKCYMHAYHT